LSGVVLALFASAVVLAVVEGVLVRRLLQLAPSTSFKHTSLKTVAQQSFTFLGIDFVIAAAASINYLVITKLANEANLGLFNAATQIISPVALLVQTLAASLLPSLSRQAQTQLANMGRSTAQLLSLKLSFMLPLVIGLFYLCEPAFQLLYGRAEFAAASPLLRIIVWGNVCIVFTSVLGQTLVAGMREGQVLRLVLVIATFEVVLNAALVWWLGVLGAAITMLVVRIAYVIPHIHFARAMLPELSIAQAIKQPMLAALGMGLALAVAHAAGAPALAALGISSGVFLGFLGLLHHNTIRRGLHQLALTQSR
jgi:O-antigen/teichoic acid export membrane protein